MTAVEATAPAPSATDTVAAKPTLVVRDEGFTVLSEGTTPIVDIIFIHGIQGHPKNTWSFLSDAKVKPKGSSLRAMFRRKVQSTGSDDTDDSNTEKVFWPHDLLPTDCMNARILTYGYDSHVSHFFKGPANQNNINAHGRSLLNALELHRREFPKRPILFVVHSLGGIILKEALRRSKNASKDDEDLRDIYESTYAIIFFGTPHRGSAYAKVGIVAEHIVKVAGFDTSSELLRNLKPDAGHLELLREEFSTMLDERAFKIYSFQEAKGFKGVDVLSRKIVDDASSSLDHPVERKDFINANHMMMCRFTTKEDDGYIKVRGAIAKYVEEIRKKGEHEQQLLDQQQEKLRKIILLSLRTAAMNQREEQIGPAHSHTFDWVFSDPGARFQDWMKSDQGIFWIKGKPGSGKSTLMKYILNDKRTRLALSSRSRTILSMPAFFFHDRGAYETQKSFEGLLRSILFQILSDVPALTSTIASIFNQRVEQDGQCDWSISDLDKARRAILQQRKVEGCVCLFVDALDEFKGRKEDITQFLKDLALPAPGQKLTVRICASSREWTVFGLLLDESPYLRLQDWTVGDIKRFADEKLAMAKRSGSEQLLDEIIKRAEGVFLWVKLVIDELWEPLINGDPISNLASLLSDLPDELPLFYQRMLSKIPSRDHEAAICMFELVMSPMYGKLGLPAFSLAVDLLHPGSCLPKDLRLDEEETTRRCEEIQRRVKACSGGLLDVPGTNPECQVQFVHQTAKTFVRYCQDRSPFDGKSATDLAVGGLEREIRLVIQLFGHMAAKPCSLLFLSGWFIDKEPDCPKEYPYYDAHLVFEFISRVKATESLGMITSQAIVDEFRNAISVNCGPRWLETHWSVNSVKRPTLSGELLPVGFIAPTSFLEFLVQHRCLLLAEREIRENTTYASGIDGVKLLYYAIVGNARGVGATYNHPTSVLTKYFEDFARFLLENDCDPNAFLTLTTTYDQGRLMNGGAKHPIEPLWNDEAEMDDKAEMDDEAETDDNAETNDKAKMDDEVEMDDKVETREITALHLALAVACSYDQIDELLRIPRLDMVRFLVEGGGNATLNYRNYWGAREGEAEERSAVHYLLYKAPGDRNPFDDPDLGRALSKCIMSFLDNGLDPNTVDSDGVSILECALPFCPSDFIETLLQKGARITPGLLTDTGRPLSDFADALDRPRFKKMEFYSPEARKLVRRRNSEWIGLEKQHGGVAQSLREISQSTAGSLRGLASFLWKT